MRSTLALSEPLWAELTEALADPLERAGILVGNWIIDERGSTFLAQAVYWSPEEAYEARSATHLDLRSTGWVPAARAAMREGKDAAFIHTHPGGFAEFSGRDDVVDSLIGPELRSMSKRDHHLSVVVAGSQTKPAISARTVPAEGTFKPVGAIRIAGQGLRILLGADDYTINPSSERQVRLLGKEGQRVLETLRVGVVGGGGTGSAVCEQLLRLGVGEIVLIDDDIVTSTTVRRGYGSAPVDVGKLKTEVIGNLACRLDGDTVLTEIPQNIRQIEAAKMLRHCDVIMGCTDGHSSRIVLNRAAYFHLAPLIDMGVLVQAASDDGFVEIVGRVTWVSPCAACLLCRQRVDPAIAQAESLDPEERRELAAQRYIPDLDEPAPSLVPYTTLVAAYAVSELLNRLFGFADTVASEIVVRPTARDARLNTRKSRPGCFCSEPAKWGSGVREPYLDLLWPQP